MTSLTPHSPPARTSRAKDWLLGAWTDDARNVRQALYARRDRIVAALFGILYFVALTDRSVLDPRRADLLSGGDNGFHAIARDYAQWDAWHWPLTRIDNFLWPVGTTTVFTDANPWLVLAMKVLLPRSVGAVQLTGPWLAAMFGLQGWFGARIAALGTEDRLVRALSGALFTTAPALAFRLGHDTLCAHFLLLVLIEAALTPPRDARTSHAALARTVAVVTFASGLHPTLFAMTIPLAVVAAARHLRRTPASAALGAGLVAGPLLVWFAWGNFGTRVQTGTVGFGFFSTNLLSFFDPVEPHRSVFFPPLPHGPGQYEGIAYLGAGALVVVAVAVVATVRARRVPRDRWTWALVAACAACLVFALSDHVKLGDWQVADLTALYRPFPGVTGAFRSSGRFVWPMYYAVISFGVLAVARLRPPLPRALVATALGLQLVDAHHVDGRAIFSLVEPLEAPSAGWRAARSDYARLVLDPPDVWGGFARCEGPSNTVREFQLLARVGIQQRLVLNSGITSRFDVEPQAAYCAEVARDRREGRFDGQSIYVPSKDVAETYRTNAALTCGRLDGHDVCVRADRPTPLQRLLASPRGPEIALAGDPRVDLADGFEAASGETTTEGASRWAAARATVRLTSPSPGGGWLSFTGRIAKNEIAERTVVMRVLVDGREIDRVPVRHPTFRAVERVAGDASTVTFELSGTMRQTGDDPNPGHLWELRRLEWVPDDR